MKVFGAILVFLVGGIVGFELGQTYEYHYGSGDIRLHIVPPSNSPRVIPEANDPLPGAESIFELQIEDGEPAKAKPYLY